VSIGAVAAVLAFLAVVLGFVTAVLGLLNQARSKKTAGTVREISVNVDGRLSDLFERQAELIAALHASGTPVPPEKMLMPSRDQDSRIRLLQAAVEVLRAHVTSPERLTRPSHTSPPGHASATVASKALPSRRKPETMS